MRLFTLIVGGALSLVGPGSAVGQDDCVLVLKNGDHVTGAPLPSDDSGALRWRSDWFLEPLALAPAGLERIEFPRRDVVSDAPPVRLVLWDGTVLYGTLRGVDEDSVRFFSERHQEVELRRDAVARLDNLDAAGNLLFDGLLGLDLWTQPDGGQKWKFEDGVISTDSKGAVLFRRLPEQGLIAVDIELSAKSFPLFRLAFGAGEDTENLRHAFSAQSMGPAIVLHRQSGESLLYHRAEWPALETGKVSVRFEFDPAAGRLRVYEGLELKGELVDEDNLDVLENGLMLVNGAFDLSLHRLRVTRGGTTETGRERTPMVDGRQVRHIDEELRIHGVDADGNEFVHERQDYDIVEFPPAPDGGAGAPRRNVRLEYYDGSVISGEYHGAIEPGLLVRQPWSERPVLLGYTGAKKISFTGAEGAVDMPAGVIEAEGLRLRGSVVGGGESGIVRWMPHHGVESTSLDLAVAGRITFSGRASTVPPQDELHLLNGDVIPCEVLALTEHDLFVRVNGEEKKLPREAFKAARLWRGKSLIEGFQAGEWKRRGGSSKTKVADGVMHLHDQADMVHLAELPAVLHLSMDAEFEADGSFSIGLCEDGSANVRARRGLGVHLMLQGGRLRASAMVQQPQNGNHFVVHNASPRQRPEERLVDLGAARSAHIDVYVDLPERRCVVFGNGTQILNTRIEKLRDIELGAMYFSQQASANGQQEMVLWLGDNGQVRQPKGPSQSPVDVLNFRARAWVGYLAEESLDRLLTRRRGTPRKSMTDLLRAPNGDVLRGQLLSLQDGAASFKQRLDKLAIPREKIAEIVCLADLVPPEEDAETLTAALFGGGSITLTPGSCDREFLRGTAPVLGEVSIPWSTVASLQLGSGHQKPPSPYEAWVQYDPMTIDTSE